jgi:hypothetical protein
MGTGDTGDVMNHIPNSAIAMATGLLIIILVLLVHLMMSQAPGARLQFLLDLLGDGEDRSGSSSPLGPSPCPMIMGWKLASVMGN